MDLSIGGNGIPTKPDNIILSKDVKGVFEDTGHIKATGTVYFPGMWKADILKKYQHTWLGKLLIKDADKFSWVDILAFTMALDGKHYAVWGGKSVEVYWAGKRELEEITLIVDATLISKSNGSVTWNSQMDNREKANPINRYTKGISDPYNPDSQYYSTDVAVFAVDTWLDVIMYANGEIVWLAEEVFAPGERYFDKENGTPVSYDQHTRILTFSTGAEFNVEKRQRRIQGGEWEKPGDEVWYNKILNKLLTDQKLQYMLLGSLVLLLVVKARRNKR